MTSTTRRCVLSLLALVLAGALCQSVSADTLNVPVQNAFTKRCLADTNGAEVVRWEVPQLDCDLSQQRQQWNLRWGGLCDANWCAGRDLISIENAATKRCLAIRSASNANVQPAIPVGCVSAWGDQKWVQVEGRLINYVTRRCLAIVSAHDHVGQPSVQADCEPAFGDQQWILTRPPEPGPAPQDDPCALEPAAPGLRLEVSFRRGRKLTTTGFGRQPRVRGRLVREDGSPVAGASLCVIDIEAQAGSVPTDARGRFTYRLRAGHSRRVSFVHRADQASAVGSVRVAVRPVVRLRATRATLRNGQKMTLRGRLRPRPPRGAVVELQVRDGGRWRTWEATRARRDGRFSGSHRFTRTLATHTYRLRARVVPNQAGYPYASGASRTEKVLVLGSAP